MKQILLIYILFTAYVSKAQVTENTKKERKWSDWIAHIIRYENDSLSVPDSLFTQYNRVFWDKDTLGTIPGYYDSLPAGFFITWTEYYTDGEFYIKLYRNYLMAGLYHQRPIPNSLIYMQKITDRQFERISELLLESKLQRIVSEDRDTSEGKVRIHYRLNEPLLGLYSNEDCAKVKQKKKINDLVWNGTLYRDSVSELQFQKGLTGFIETVNGRLKKRYRISMPVTGEMKFEKALPEGFYFEIPLYNYCH